MNSPTLHPGTSTRKENSGPHVPVPSRDSAVSGRAEGRVGEALEIFHKLARRYVNRDATPEDTFRDLRIDCLDRTCIALEVEDLIGRELRDDEIEKWCSVADVLALVGEAL